jgi:hypothetical protein
VNIHTAFGAARITGRGVAALTAYMVAWRAFTIPLAAFALWLYVIVPAWGPAGWLLLAAAAAIGFASMMDHGSGFSLDALVHHVDAAMERTRRRHHATRLRRRWPEVTRQLGWDAADGKPPTTNNGRPIEGRRMKPRSPALRHVEHLGATVRVAWRPRGNVSPKAWGEHAEALRREFRGHSVRFAEDPAEPGTVVATIGMTPLPIHDNAPRPGDGQTPATQHEPGASAIPQATTNAEDGTHLAIELGARAGGGVARWVPGEVNGVLITGSTGGGKGGALRYITHQALDQGAVTHVLDPKGTGEHAWVTDFGGHLHRGLERQVELLRVVAHELRSRCDDLAALGAEKVGDLPARLRPQPIVVVVDEAADLLTLRRVTAEKVTDELRSEAGALLTLIAQQGRAAGIHPVIALQRADVQALGPAGGSLRAQLVARIVTGSIDEDGLDQALGTGHRELLTHLTGHPGRALVSRLNNADGASPYPVQVRWLPVAALRPVGVQQHREAA